MYIFVFFTQYHYLEKKNVFIWQKSSMLKNFFTEKNSFTEKNINQNVKNIYLI